LASGTPEPNLPFLIFIISPPSEGVLNLFSESRMASMRFKLKVRDAATGAIRNTKRAGIR
jgi:hypothetical protein